jgi:hypothetical protein
VAEFECAIRRIEGLKPVDGTAESLEDCAFTRVVLTIDEVRIGWSKVAFKDAPVARGIPAVHANFELINSLSLFRDAAWHEWLLRADLQRTAANFRGDYP